MNSDRIISAGELGSVFLVITALVIIGSGVAVVAWHALRTFVT